MKDNKLTVEIKKPIQEVFAFAITPPNTTLWIPGIVAEETSEWPVQLGTIYKLQTDKGHTFEVTVSDLKQNQFIEWVKDQNYHCRYSFRQLSDHSTELTYYEWVDEGELDEPFKAEALANLKHVLEQDKVEPEANSSFAEAVKIMANTPPISNVELVKRNRNRKA